MNTDRAITRIAASNNGVVSWDQLMAAGVSRRAIAHRVAIGRLYRHHHGVYLLEPPPTASRLTLFTAAVYACAPNAFLSHESAAELWELTRPHRGPIHVTVAGRSPGRRKPGIKVHRTKTLTRKEVRTRRKVPTTSPSRTVSDLAPRATRDQLELMIATAERMGLVSAEESDRDAAFTRSEAERLLLRLIRQANLPSPQTNTRVEGFEVDLLWPDQKLVVEIDGYEFHKDRAAFERDRARDAKLVAAGYRIIRITWRALTERPLEVVAQIARAL